MRVIKADHERRLVVPGVPGLTRRPVDIDQSKTGFKALRSLRIYRFDADSIINGHAEEDEVFVVVLSGSIELAIGWDESPDSAGVFTLSAPGHTGSDAFVAYLPPHSNYRLTPCTHADVAYARATPRDSYLPAVFRPNAFVADADVNTLLDERTHADKLRLRVIHIYAKGDDVNVALIDGGDTAEALVYLQGSSAEGAATISVDDGEAISLNSWDTLAVGPGERPVLHVNKGESLWVMTVLAV